MPTHEHATPPDHVQTAWPLTPVTGGVAAATRTLPRDITSFTGREPEFRRLAEAAAGAGGVVSIHAIGGMAGVGKTAFAVHAAHQLAEQFPDGQIFFSSTGIRRDSGRSTRATR